MRKRKIRRGIQIFLMMLSLSALAFVISLAYMGRKTVVKAVTIEAGTGSVNIDDF